MLPSNFKRSDTYSLLKEKIRKDFIEEESTAGPADYQIEKIIGKERISQAGIKAAPQYSFGRTLTHRTIDSGRSRSVGRKSKGAC